MQLAAQGDNAVQESNLLAISNKFGYAVVAHNAGQSLAKPHENS